MNNCNVVQQSEVKQNKLMLVLAVVTVILLNIVVVVVVGVQLDCFVSYLQCCGITSQRILQNVKLVIVRGRWYGRRIINIYWCNASANEWC